jgi:hypothetical protein
MTLEQCALARVGICDSEYVRSSGKNRVVAVAAVDCDGCRNIR